jgi:hypothetical protein
MGAFPLVALALLLARHPMHTSVAELRFGEGAEVQVRLRMFQDDVTTATGAEPARVRAYVQQRFLLYDRDGRPVAMVIDTVASEGDALEVRASAPAPAGLKVRHTILQERFADQVNVVRVITPSGTRTLLFLPGDAAKPVL